jgi:hypothetical protein
MKFGTGNNPKVITIGRLMEMLVFAERTGKFAVVPFIEQAIRNLVLEA